MTRRNPVSLHAPVRVVVALAALCLTMALPLTAYAALPPHVTEPNVSPEACAICHRTHSSNVDTGYRTTASVDLTGNALIVAPASELGTPGFPAPNRGDVGLCYTCHGAAGLGSQFSVETSFTLESSHSIAPMKSAFGPSPKMCSSCHDSHGTDRAPGGQPYPRLLRSWVDTTTKVFRAEEYCAACHTSRAASRFDSVAVYRRTGHYLGMPDPASGTRIRCSNCHAAHGSAIAPLITTPFVPPAAPTTVSVVANDRRLCLACHPNPAHTWSGETTYALSAHAISTTTVPIPGEWPAAGAKRRLGECQVCHAPMGRSDGVGGTITKLLEKPGRALCDTCHKPAGVASTDLKSLAYPPSSANEAAALELIVAWGPDPRSAYAGRTDVYGRATAGADPRPLIGPRAYAAPGASGAAAIGDIDGDGRPELVRANAGAKTLTILRGDPLLGLTASTSVVVTGTPDFIAIGRFVEPTFAETLSGPRPQIAILDATAGVLRLYESYVNGTLTLVAARSYGPLGGTGTGLAVGDFTGGALADLAVTTQGADQLLLFTQDITPSLDQLALQTTVPGLLSPRGPSVGDIVGSAANEVVVCCLGDSTVRVFDGAGAPGPAFGLLATGQPWASAIGDVTGSAANEVAVAVRNPAGPASLAVFTGAGVESDHYPVGAFSGSVLVADVDGDGKAETLLGNAGFWGAAGTAVAPSVAVYRSTGVALAFERALIAGGAELAGAAPALLTADFGPVLPSRHPIDELAVSHVSTETGAFARHSTCSDCHDSHEASSGVSAVAPFVTGDMRGAWGSGVTNTGAGAQTASPAARARRQYEVCFKCHATVTGGRSNIASLVNTRNASVHAVEGSSAAAVAFPGSYVGGWSNDSILYCTDCHGNTAGAEARGLHRSAEAPLLKAPFTATGASEPTLLCYECHAFTTYYAGDVLPGTDGGLTTSSRFYDVAHAAPRRALHHFHSATAADGGLGFACSACHVTHGAVTEPHLLRIDIGYVSPSGSDRAACANACHGDATNGYAGP